MCKNVSKDMLNCWRNVPWQELMSLKKCEDGNELVTTYVHLTECRGPTYEQESSVCLTITQCMHQWRKEQGNTVKARLWKTIIIVDERMNVKDNKSVHASNATKDSLIQL